MKVIGGDAEFFHIGAMLRRPAIAILFLLFAAGAAAAAPKPYRVSLVGDAFDGKAWHTGVLVELDPGWKTYWRMPGEAGIPPEFTWTPSAPARVEVAYPVPARHADKSGEAVGYEREVLFPVTVTPEAAGAVDLDLDMFFAVCNDICIPAEAKASIALGTAENDPLGSARVEIASQAVPVPGDLVTTATLAADGGKPVLVLALKERPEDIFVETTTTAYFRAPAFSAGGREARLAIDNAGDPARLAGQQLKLTYVIGGKGHEQAVTLP